MSKNLSSVNRRKLLLSLPVLAGGAASAAVLASPSSASPEVPSPETDKGTGETENRLLSTTRAMGVGQEGMKPYWLFSWESGHHSVAVPCCPEAGEVGIVALNGEVDSAGNPPVYRAEEDGYARAEFPPGETVWWTVATESFILAEFDELTTEMDSSLRSVPAHRDDFGSGKLPT